MDAERERIRNLPDVRKNRMMNGFSDIDLGITIYPKWDDDGAYGYAEVYLTGLFPCSQKQFRKFMRLLGYCYNRDALILSVREFLERDIERLENERGIYGRQYFTHKDAADELQTQIERHRRPSGVYLTEDEIRQFRRDEKQERKLSNDAMRNYKKAEKGKRQDEWCLANLK